MLAYRKLIFCV